MVTQHWPQLRAQLKSDPRSAACTLRPLAHDGDRWAQFLLGLLLVNGVGVTRDDSAALHWFARSAQAEEPMAMNMLGRCHEYGLGTPVDYEAAAQWYWRAASYDDDWAMYNYAHLLANGRGVRQDRAAAFLWFRLAASRGHARAMHFLGLYYENGWETPVDRAAAYSWYRRSAEGGDYRGQCSYASVLAQDDRIDEALKWLVAATATATPAYLAVLAAKLAASTHEKIRLFARALAVDPRLASSRES